jgi:hypothetical protein
MLNHCCSVTSVHHGGGPTVYFKIGNHDDCPNTSLSATGLLVTCAAFGAVYDLIEAIAPSGSEFTCSDRW